MCEKTGQVSRRPLKHFKVEKIKCGTRWRVVEEQGDGSPTTVSCQKYRLTANHKAKKAAKKERYGALVTYGSAKQPQQPLLVVGISAIHKLFREKVLPTGIFAAFLCIAAILLVITTMPSASEPLYRIIPISVVNTDLVFTPAALFLTVATAIAGLIALDHKTPWQLRRTIVVEAINLSVVSLFTITLAVVCDLVREERIQNFFRAIIIATLILIIWGIWRLLTSLYFFAINAESRCVLRWGSVGEDTPAALPADRLSGGYEDGCGGDR